jgi:hypothetical protein
MQLPKIAVLITLVTATIKLHSQPYLGLVFHQTNIQGRQAYSFGVTGEYRLWKSKNWFLNYQHDVGVTNQGLVFVHTTLPFIGGMYALASNKHSHSHNHSDAYAYGFMLMLLAPSGLSYYYTQTKQRRCAIYANPLNYAYWQTRQHSEMSTLNPEAGFKILKHLKGDAWLMFSVGLGYSVSIGSKNLLPKPYSNSFFTSVKIAIVVR